MLVYNAASNMKSMYDTKNIELIFMTTAYVDLFMI
jgi:hypothetical protein